MAKYRGGGIKWDRVYVLVTPATHGVGRDVERIARRNLTQHVRTGRLLSSLKGKKGLAVYRITIGTDHWIFIEYGTRAHEIRPKARQALSWPKAAHPVRRVWHPGTPAYAPMRRALLERKRV